MRNISIHNSYYGINFFWSWGFTFIGLNVDNVTIALDMTAGGSTSQQVHAVTVIDSTISNAQIGFNTARNSTSLSPGAGVLNLENVKFKNVQQAVVGASGTVIPGTNGTKTVAAYSQGHRYNPNGPQEIQKVIPANSRPSSLLGKDGKSYYTRPKPQYGDVPLAQFVSVRLTGAVGNGIKDDTDAIQQALNATSRNGQVLFFDAGTYRVTRTLYIPSGARIVGESYSVIMSSGSYFNNVKKPRAVVQVGVPGETGEVEWSDMIVSTQGGNIGQIGAILIEWNLASSSSAPSGMWDVHTRIGGFIGSNFQGATCPTTPTSPKSDPQQINEKCYAAFMSLYVTESASGLYLENNWFWTADHDIDANYGGNQITIYTGRGMLIESTAGNIWLYGTAVSFTSIIEPMLSCPTATNILQNRLSTIPSTNTNSPTLKTPSWARSKPKPLTGNPTPTPPSPSRQTPSTPTPSSPATPSSPQTTPPSPFPTPTPGACAS